MEIYDEWNIVKKSLSSKERNLLFKEGEIWWCSVGMNVGHEIYGKGKWFLRHVLILKKLSRKTCIIIPLTSKIKEGSWFCEIMYEGKIVTAMLHQIKMIGIERLQERMATLRFKSFKKVKEGLGVFFGMGFNFHSDEPECSGYIPKMKILYRPEFPSQEEKREDAIIDTP